MNRRGLPLSRRTLASAVKSQPTDIYGRLRPDCTVGRNLPSKPAGVIAAELWVKIGPTPPVDPSELTFLVVDTRTPYVPELDGADGG